MKNWLKILLITLGVLAVVLISFLAYLVFFNTTCWPNCLTTHQESEALQPLANICQANEDCFLPMEYAIQSNCLFGTVCIEDACAVVCPMYNHDNLQGIWTYQYTCKKDSDCDCSERGERSIDCRCEEGVCLSVEDWVEAETSSPVACTAQQRNVDTCIELYEPVCATVEIQCVTTPCDPIQQTFENSCKACANPLVSSYVPGACL